ncbi:MAG: DUF2993 domain-containing protein [Moorea sp. SIO2B7]|nr:DUF2993 domain-containing protein [Moorena sp. SIO2B7]
MEIFTIFLSSLLTILTPAGLILDSVSKNTLRSQFEEVEELEVRIDNAPSYQIIQGKVQKIRLASRGLQLTPAFRIDTLELETDPINIDLSILQQRGENALQKSLRQPLQGAVRLVLSEDDLNRALQSPEIKTQLQKFVNQMRGNSSQRKRYELLNTHIELLGDNRLRVQVQLRRANSVEQESEPLDIMLELGLNVVAGRNLQLVEPVATVNGRKLSRRILNGFAKGLTGRLDLRTLEDNGITARLLQLKMEGDEIDLAAFVRVQPLASMSPLDTSSH